MGSSHGLFGNPKTSLHALGFLPRFQIATMFPAPHICFCSSVWIVPPASPARHLARLMACFASALLPWLILAAVPGPKDLSRKPSALLSRFGGRLIENKASSASLVSR